LNAAIIGCGYLGSEVASIWRKRGIHVTATTRHPENLTRLTQCAQKGVLIKGNDELELAPLIAANETIVVTVAADGPEYYESAYRDTAQIFRHLAIEMDLPRHLIYTSSTSVYGDHLGRWVDEESDLFSKTEQGKILIEAEEIYQSLAELGWHVCIFRLAELYGPGREISQRVKNLEGRALPSNGAQYTNMIHKEDAASALDYSFRHHLEGIYNLADDDHPSRKELYDTVAHHFQLPPPQWDPKIPHTLHAGNKRISNHKIKAEGYSFRHPHRVIL
jgi:nucleoside-diphosphate-sugar epimerase